MSDSSPRDDSDDERASLDALLASNAISIPIEVRVGGATRILLGRGLLTGPEILVSDGSGRIPTFENARAAVGWGKRALPVPGDAEEARFAQIMSDAFTDRQY